MHDGPRVKICGLCRRQDALTADALGVDYLGVVLTPGFGRSVTVAEGSSILEGVGATRVAVVVDESADRVAAVARALPAKVIQLHGSEAPEWVRELRAHGEWTIWKALRARAPEDVARTLDVFSAARDLIPEPLDLILAGGLTPGSVGSAVARFQPDVVDVSSGVEARPREKDPDRLRRFVQNARGAAGVSRRSSREPRGEGPS
jgi:phosphoribosylanthranilate isomerase